MLVGGIEHPEAISEVLHRVLIKRNQIFLDVPMLANRIREAIIAGLQTMYASSMDRFAVTLVGSNGSTYMIKLMAKDEIGYYIYHGTAAHTVYPVNMEAMSSLYSGGFNPLLHPVNGELHIPAHAPRSPEIDAMVDGIAMAIIKGRVV